ncbi:MAG TPA: DUF4062 domain-containing protein [Symbiobacteriaceae bacterium]|nr:DUF4062 domain-containing protein [Symbiobacteriaceae bacterium]
MEERIVRVVVSSTFRDMDAEQNHLATHVLPALRRRCADRGIIFIDVDLQWDIPKEVAAVPVCLDGIDRCRPFFVGLLDERYGWALDGGPSITDLEIHHGALDALSSAEHACLFIAPHPTLTPCQQPGPAASVRVILRGEPGLKHSRQRSGVADCLLGQQVGICRRLRLPDGLANLLADLAEVVLYQGQSAEALSRARGSGRGAFETAFPMLAKMCGEH